MKIYKLILLFLVLSSCGQVQQTNIEDIDLKDFFWNISEYETPKILVYEVKNNGVVEKKYMKLERSSDCELIITRYDNELNKVLTLKDSVGNDGFYLTEHKVIEENGTITEKKIDVGYIFSFDLKKEMTIKSSFFSENELEYNFSSTWKFESLAEIIVLNKSFQSIISTGTSELTVTDTLRDINDTYKGEMKVWYVKGLGIIKLIETYQNEIYEENYIETISIEKFNSIKKSKLTREI